MFSISREWIKWAMCTPQTKKNTWTQCGTATNLNLSLHLIRKSSQPGAEVHEKQSRHCFNFIVDNFQILQCKKYLNEKKTPLSCAWTLEKVSSDLVLCVHLFIFIEQSNMRVKIEHLAELIDELALNKHYHFIICLSKCSKLMSHPVSFFYYFSPSKRNSTL